MKMSFLKAGVASLALAAGLASLALAQPAPTLQPRAVTERVAQQIDANFYDVQQGGVIAADLRRRARAGEFDRYRNPFDLAAALSARLHPYDGHFGVTYAPPSSAPATPNAPPANAGQLAAEAAARANYGFARVEMLPGGIGYIDLRGAANFTQADAATSPARRTADAAMTMLSGAQAIIIDQRDCAGGSPAMVGYLVSYFTPEGADIFNTFRGRRGEFNERPIASPAGPRRLQTPLFIVNSGRTASACESIAYTLQATHRGTIVGVPSAGAGNISPIYDAGGGFSVQVASALSVNPITHRNWEGSGVAPDVAAPVEDAVTRARELALEAALHAPANEAAATEARWALEALRASGQRLPEAELSAYAGDYGQRSIAIEHGRLVLHRDRRPGLTLTPLSRDLFAIDDATPLQRLRFERDAGGRVIALVVNAVNGPEARNLRVSS